MVPGTNVSIQEQTGPGTHTQMQDAPTGAIDESNNEDASVEAWNKL
jgi:hypothetical protein